MGGGIGLLFKWLFPTPYQLAQRSFAKRIAEARAKHQPVRHIQQEQREWLHRALIANEQEAGTQSETVKS